MPLERRSGQHRRHGRNDPTATTSVGSHLWPRADEVDRGDSVVLQLPGGTETLTVLEVKLRVHCCGTFRETTWIRVLGKETRSPTLT